MRNPFPFYVWTGLCLVGLFAFALFACAAATRAQVLAPVENAAPATEDDVATAKPRPDRKPVETMMFSIDEYNDIQGRLAGAGDGKSKLNTAIEKADLYLSTILYNGPKDWTIWINGVPVGPNQDFQSFQVTSIAPNYVELLVPLSAQGMRPVRLGPNQTFIAKSGTVIEGRLH